jgi:phosphoribosylglycinamide formyltransferase-1
MTSPSDIRHPALGFLASHGGSNMQAIIDACREGRLCADPRVAISNNSTSMALQRARRAGIPAYHLSAVTHPDAEVLDREILRVLRAHGVDLVVLAGYMKKLGPHTLAAYPRRIVNIHPALLPRFGGEGMYGKLVHQAVLAAGVQTTGVTIHVVDDDYDRGRILAQHEVPVLAGDTPDSLAERVLKVEHRLYVETLRKICMGEIPLG